MYQLFRKNFVQNLVVPRDKDLGVVYDMHC